MYTGFVSAVAYSAKIAETLCPLSGSTYINLILKGKKIAAKTETQTIRTTSSLVAKLLLVPILAVLLVGMFSFSEAYASVDVSGPNKKDEVATWDCVYFGNYPQSDAAGKKKDPIKWRVLKVANGKALLVSDICLDYWAYRYGGLVDPYSEIGDLYGDTTWKNSSIRDWLNGKFSSAAFSTKELSGVCATSTGTDTSDKVFLLSKADMRNKAYGFSSENYDDKRLAMRSKYATKQSDRNEMNQCGEYSCYMLRDIVSSTGVVSGVSCDGGFLGKFYEGQGNYIRPAIWVKLSASSLKYAGTVSSDGTVVNDKLKQRIKGVVTSKSFSRKSLSKKSKSFKLNAKGTTGAKVSYKIAKYVKSKSVSVKAAKKTISVSKAGKVVVKRNAKKGTYVVKVKITASSTFKYKAASVTKTIKVKVK